MLKSGLVDKTTLSQTLINKAVWTFGGSTQRPEEDILNPKSVHNCAAS